MGAMRGIHQQLFGFEAVHPASRVEGGLQFPLTIFFAVLVATFEHSQIFCDKPCIDAIRRPAEQEPC